ncbi:energy-coupling factor transporter transmembrane component T [Bacillus badius]|uniref:energy-coupling factor transporter transmembrane component T n=1 Tax=Bacillus badius TaxID=1455 RepID=UPI0005978272|nr:energy-coupling factor transporter transmembrane component T [Bacillus badius]KIL74704.1 Membrane protein [Bacillus badius]
MNINNITLKKCLLSVILLVLVFSFGATTAHPVIAEVTEDNKDKKYTVHQGIMDSINEKSYGMFKDSKKRNYYYLDMVSERDANKAKSDSKWEDIKDTLFGWTDVKGNFTDNYNLSLNSIANLVFRFNVFMTSTMLTVLDFSFSVNVIGDLITSLEKAVKEVTGISGGRFTNGGLFGGMLYIIAVLAVAYMLYTFVVKRAFLESLGALVKTLVALSAALLILSNYSSFIQTTQGLSNNMTAYVMGLASWGNGSEKVYFAKSPQFDAVEEKANVKDSLWSMFVDRPYLYMQYGTHNLNEIEGGKKRVLNVLQKKPGEERNEVVLNKEIKEHNNDMMVSNSVLDRLAFTPFYTVINGVVSIPIFLLALMLVVLQFWFIVIAAIAPFALLIGAIPGFFNVLKRYAIELSIPLALKVFFAFFTVVLLILSQALYAIRVSEKVEGGSFMDYIFVAVFQFVLFLTIFLLRKRLMNIFSSGSQVITGLREASGSWNPVEHAKKGVQATATVAGAAVGASTGGLQGAVVGANVGNTAGRLATGEAGMQDAANAAIGVARYRQLSKLGQEGEELDQHINTENPTAVKEVLTEHGSGEEQIEETNENVEQQKPNEAESAEFAGQQEEMKEEELPKEVATEMNQVGEGSSIEDKEPTLYGDSSKNEEPEELVTTDTVANFANEKGINEEKANNIQSSLNKAGLEDVTADELNAQYNKLQDQQGDLKGDFSEELARGIKTDRLQAAAQQPNSEMLHVQPMEEEASDISSNPLDEMNDRSYVNDVVTPFENPTMDSADGGDTSSPVIGADMEGEALKQSVPVVSSGMDSDNMSASSASSSDIEETDFKGSDMRGTDLGTPSLEENNMSSSNLNSSEIDHSKLGGSDMNTTPIGNSHFGASKIETTSFSSQPMDGNKMKEKESTVQTNREQRNIEQQPLVGSNSNAPQSSVPKLTPIQNAVNKAFEDEE